MLLELHVVDLGIVADLDLVLGAGLTAITGETGAGKTLLVEALELLVGGRADVSLVRDGAGEARVEGRFVDTEAGTEVVLTRVVPRDGRSRAYIDGRLATVGELAERGAGLVDLHGQHVDHTPPRSRGATQRPDRYAGEPRAHVAGVSRRARMARGRARSRITRRRRAERAREVDLLRFQVNEIASAAIVDADEEAVLEQEEALLADAVPRSARRWPVRTTRSKARASMRSGKR